VILGAVCSVVVRAEAQEYCVTCTTPPGLYRCIIEGAKPGGAQSLQMFCITTMARMGHHETCSVKGGTVFDCDGQVKRIPWSAQSEPRAASGKETAKPGAGADANKQPPQTVEDMARRTNQKTAEQVKKANENTAEQTRTLGDKLGDATKKTWRCVTSLFTRCTQ
jgi:hypothetical protein